LSDNNLSGSGNGKESGVEENQNENVEMPDAMEIKRSNGTPHKQTKDKDDKLREPTTSEDDPLKWQRKEGETFAGHLLRVLEFGGYNFLTTGQKFLLLRFMIDEMTETTAFR